MPPHAWRPATLPLGEQVEGRQDPRRTCYQHRTLHAAADWVVKVVDVVRLADPAGVDYQLGVLGGRSGAP